jgi:hypothetical protein
MNKKKGKSIKRDKSAVPLGRHKAINKMTRVSLSHSIITSNANVLNFPVKTSRIVDV